MRNAYGIAVLGPQGDVLEGVELEGLDDVDGFFDFVGKAVESIDKAYVHATPRWFRKAMGAAVGPAKMAWDAADNIAHGQRLDRALLDAGKNQVDIFKTAAPFAQIGLSFIPGVGQGISAAIGAGLALANGKPITEALIAGVKGAIPGGPLVQQAVDLGMKAAVDVASGKRWDEVALNAVRSRLPGGEAGKIAFDTGLALAQGKKLQDVGLAAAGRFVPNNPLAQGAFEMTKRALAGKPLEGAGAAAVARMATTARPTAPGPVRRAAAPHYSAPHSRMALAIQPPRAGALAHAQGHTAAVLLGVAAAAAAGGGALWWWKHSQAEGTQHGSAASRAQGGRR
jgi:hypothetical protein